MERHDEHNNVYQTTPPRGSLNGKEFDLEEAANSSVNTPRTTRSTDSSSSFYDYGEDHAAYILEQQRQLTRRCQCRQRKKILWSLFCLIGLILCIVWLVKKQYPVRWMPVKSSAPTVRGDDGDMPTDKTSGSGNNDNNSDGTKRKSCSTTLPLRQESPVMIGSALKDLSGKDDGSFGEAMDLSETGTVLAVGIDSFELDGQRNVGKVQVLEWNQNLDDWDQLGQALVGRLEDDSLGSSVAVSADGSMVAIGAPQKRGFENKRRGYVQIYKYNKESSKWVQVGSDLVGEQAGGCFGVAVDFSANGSVVAVGDYCNSIDGESVGRAYAFALAPDPTDWTQQIWVPRGQVLAGRKPGDNFGRPLTLSADGSVLAVSALTDKNGPGTDKKDEGRVEVFRYHSDLEEWVPKGQDLRNNQNGGNRFGSGISLSSRGTVLAVSSVYIEGSGSEKNTFVRVYAYDEIRQEWLHRGADLQGDASDDYFGMSLSLADSGERLAVGTNIFSFFGTDSRKGYVRVYDWEDEGSCWALSFPQINEDEASNSFGSKVSLSPDGEVLALHARSG